VASRTTIRDQRSAPITHFSNVSCKRNPQRTTPPHMGSRITFCPRTSQPALPTDITTVLSGACDAHAPNMHAMPQMPPRRTYRREQPWCTSEQHKQATNGTPKLLNTNYWVCYVRPKGLVKPRSTRSLSSQIGQQLRSWLRHGATELRQRRAAPRTRAPAVPHHMSKHSAMTWRLYTPPHHTSRTQWPQNSLAPHNHSTV
jgi:hypothetical protein